jgi:hypothetical protein
MAQAILINDNKVVSDLITANLTAYLGLDLIHRKNGQETLGLLAILPNVNLIITSAKIGEELTALKIGQYIVKNKLEAGVIVMGQQQGEAKDDFTFMLKILMIGKKLSN